jgi:hypothetical protein
LADKSICSCAYDKLNDDATKMYGKEWGTNPAILQDERFFMLFKKQQCSANKAQVASMFVLYSFNIMAVMRNESYQLSFFVMETAKIQIRH